MVKHEKLDMHICIQQVRGCAPPQEPSRTSLVVTLLGSLECVFGCIYVGTVYLEASAAEC